MFESSDAQAEVPRNLTRPVRVGSVQVGGGAPVSVQSMCTTKTDDPASTLEQIGRLADARVRDRPRGDSHRRCP